VGWQVVTVAGGPRERGRSYGEQARDRIRSTVALYERIFEAYASLPWAEVRRRAGAFTDPIEAYDVELLPEIEGIAEGAGLDAEDVLAVNLRTEIMFGMDARPGRVPRECTALGVAGDRPLVAQTWDWKPGARETVVMLVCTPTGRPGFVTLVEAGLLAKIGMNDAGLAIATNALQSTLDRGEPGVPFHAILRRVLTSATFDEAVDAIERGPRASSANYLVGSADGRVTDLECTPGGPAEVYRPEVPAHANHFLRPRPRPFKDLGAIDGADSVHRQGRALAALDEPADASIREALVSHDGGPDLAVCQHEHPGVDPVMDHATITAMVAEPAAGLLHVAAGNPCSASFETFGVHELLAGTAASV
jgi:isopenicillin-N N-acyltransferase-like protein